MKNCWNNSPRSRFNCWRTGRCRGWRAGRTRADAVNLLQGEFSRTTDYGERWRRWRLAAALAAALLVVHVAAQALQIRQAKHESAALDNEISQVFSSAMPGDCVGRSTPANAIQARAHSQVGRRTAILFCAPCKH